MLGAHYSGGAIMKKLEIADAEEHPLDQTPTN